MTNLQEVPTDELLSFQDYPAIHNPAINSGEAQINVNVSDEDFQKTDLPSLENPNPSYGGGGDTQKSFWTLEYYQRFFDVETKDVADRILASITPRRGVSLKRHLQKKPDLYGPFWISVTLVFTIAISGNIASYLQHSHEKYHWKYDFHLVSYAATAICLYVTVVPFTLWGLLKWSSDVNDLDGLEDGTTPSALELICVYGYSMFVYIPVTIMWTFQNSMVQWLLVLIATGLSGSVLLLTLMPALKLSRHKLLIIIGIISCHLFLAAGFMLYFFHAPANSVIILNHNTTIAMHHGNTSLHHANASLHHGNTSLHHANISLPHTNNTGIKVI